MSTYSPPQHVNEVALGGRDQKGAGATKCLIVVFMSPFSPSLELSPELTSLGELRESVVRSLHEPLKQRCWRNQSMASCAAFAPLAVAALPGRQLAPERDCSLHRLNDAYFHCMSSPPHSTLFAARGPQPHAQSRHRLPDHCPTATRCSIVHGRFPERRYLTIDAPLPSHPHLQVLCAVPSPVPRA